MAYYNTSKTKSQGREIAFGALNYRLLLNLIGAYLIVWGTYNCVVCDINYMALPAFVIGMLIYGETK